MLNLEERKLEEEVEKLYTWKEKYISSIDRIVDMVKKEAPKAYENEEFQQWLKDLKEGLEKHCTEEEKRIRDLTDYTKKSRG